MRIRGILIDLVFQRIHVELNDLITRHITGSVFTMFTMVSLITKYFVRNELHNSSSIIKRILLHSKFYALG